MSFQRAFSLSSAVFVGFITISMIVDGDYGKNIIIICAAISAALVFCGLFNS